MDWDIFEDVPDDVGATGLAADQRIRVTRDKLASLVEEVSPNAICSFRVLDQGCKDLASFLLALREVCRREEETFKEDILQGTIVTLRVQKRDAYPLPLMTDEAREPYGDWKLAVSFNIANTS